MTMRRRRASRVLVLRHIFDYQVDELTQFCAKVESSLKKELREHDKWVRSQAAKTSPERQDEVYEWYYDEHRQLEDVFPSLFRGALFVFSYSVLEHNLDRLCRTVRGIGRLQLAPEDLADKGINRSRKYLEKVANMPPIVGPEWEALTHYNKMRNAIAHAGGRAEDRRSKLEAFIKKAAIAATINENGTLVLAAGFNEKFTETMCVFMNSVFEKAVAQETEAMERPADAKPLLVKPKHAKPTHSDR